MTSATKRPRADRVILSRSMICILTWFSNSRVDYQGYTARTQVACNTLAHTLPFDLVARIIYQAVQYRAGIDGDSSNVRGGVDSISTPSLTFELSPLEQTIEVFLCEI